MLVFRFPLSVFRFPFSVPRFPFSLFRSYSTLFTIPKNLYGMYLKGRSSHVGVVTTALWCENTRNDSLP